MTAGGNNKDAATGCGCLLVALIIFGAIGASCGSSNSTPTVSTPTTSTTTPYYYYSTPSTTTSSYAPSTSTSRAGSGSYDDDDDYDRPYVPAPTRRAPGRTHSGNSGHPCRPGERDGDNDGYCGEGR